MPARQIYLHPFARLLHLIQFYIKRVLRRSKVTHSMVIWSYGAVINKKRQGYYLDACIRLVRKVRKQKCSKVDESDAFYAENCAGFLSHHGTDQRDTWSIKPRSMTCERNYHLKLAAQNIKSNEKSNCAIYITLPKSLGVLMALASTCEVI